MITDERNANENATTGLQASSAEPDHKVPALRDPPPATTPKRAIWPWGVGALVAAIAAALLTSQFWMVRPPVIAVEIAALAPITRVLAVNGRVAAVKSVDIRPLVSGPLIPPLVAEGEAVEAGQILAQIDPAAQNTIVRQAMAAHDAALVAQQQASETYDRAKSLGSNIATSVLETNAHVLQSAVQEVARQTAVLDQAQVGLENHSVRAPFAGSVLSREATLGQLVGPTSSVLTLADLANLIVEADVDEAYATQIQRSQPAVLRLAGEVANRDGNVSYVSTRVDVATGGLSIEIAFVDPIEAPVGLTVVANIIVDERAASFSVPRTALAMHNDVEGVFVVKDGVARFQPITAVDWPAARLIVTDGLAAGDVMIIDAREIVDGNAVETEQP